jgi:hypothetical protein
MFTIKSLKSIMSGVDGIVGDLETFVRETSLRIGKRHARIARLREARDDEVQNAGDNTTLTELAESVYLEKANKLQSANELDQDEIAFAIKAIAGLKEIQPYA